MADQIEVVKPYTSKDVKHAMFSIDGNKSAGPDGYSSDFFKKAREVVGDDVTKAVLEYLENERLLKQINDTIISLIPKVECPQLASQFRPISCCNV